MNKQTVYALQELEILHALLIQQENRGNHEQASLRWAVGCFMDELVERRIENNFEQVASGDKKTLP
jgi:hypothetical protein